MEYQSEDERGQLQWYNLAGDSAIPEKVRMQHFILCFSMLTSNYSRTFYSTFTDTKLHKKANESCYMMHFNYKKI